jgi:hypothetical protein
MAHCGILPRCAGSLLDHFVLHAGIEEVFMRLLEVGTGSPALCQIHPRALSGPLGQVSAGATRRE